MDERLEPTRRPAVDPYRADPREAATDLLLGSFDVAKIVCAAVVYFSVMFAAASVHLSTSLSLLGGTVAAAAALVAVDRLANLVATRRGRAGRGLAEFGMQAARIVRRFWFMPLIPLLEHSGFPVLARLALGVVAVVIIEAALVRLLGSSSIARWFGRAAVGDTRGVPDTEAGKGRVTP